MKTTVSCSHIIQHKLSAVQTKWLPVGLFAQDGQFTLQAATTKISKISLPDFNLVFLKLPQMSFSEEEDINNRSEWFRSRFFFLEEIQASHIISCKLWFQSMHTHCQGFDSLCGTVGPARRSCKSQQNGTVIWRNGSSARSADDRPDNKWSKVCCFVWCLQEAGPAASEPPSTNNEKTNPACGLLRAGV